MSRIPEILEIHCSKCKRKFKENENKFFNQFQEDKIFCGDCDKIVINEKRVCCTCNKILPKKRMFKCSICNELQCYSCPEGKLCSKKCRNKCDICLGCSENLLKMNNLTICRFCDKEFCKKCISKCKSCNLNVCNNCAIFCCNYDHCKIVSCWGCANKIFTVWCRYCNDLKACSGYCAGQCQNF